MKSVGLTPFFFLGMFRIIMARPSPLLNDVGDDGDLSLDQLA